VPVLAALVAVAAAVRSTWSPCGLSMLSTITPFAERARGHRYGVTAGWFVAGSVLGGATLGAAAAGLAAVAAVTARIGAGGDPRWPAILVTVAVVAAAGAAVDAGVFGPVIPLWRRQVDDGWLGRYRGWVYGVGYGWQIGAGLATYIMTSAVFVMVLIGAASRNPFVAWLVCVGFGLVRGLGVLLTARASTPARLRELHRRFSVAGPPVRAAVIGVQVAVAIVAAAAAAWGRDAAVGWWVLLAMVTVVFGAVAGAAFVAAPVRSARRRTATTGLAAVAVAAIALSLAAGGCGSSGHAATATAPLGATSTVPGASPATAAPTTVAGQLPTVPNCGGGAYKPQTLLIVCGAGTAMATGVTWDAWGATSASGAGKVHVEVGGRPASGAGRLVLDMVAVGPVGPQFRRLTVTWTGPSPDGHAQDTYSLAAGG
jgi:hypothetical protein